MSDHEYITFVVGFSAVRRVANGPDRRWNLSKMDREMFDLSLDWACFDDVPEDAAPSPEELAQWIDQTMEEACNSSTPRIGRKKPRKTAYWWDDCIADLRSASIRPRRSWKRGRRRRGLLNSPEILEELENNYRSKKLELKRAISKAKTKAWRELIRTIDDDPWDLPYRLVLNRLRQSSPSFSEMVEVEVLNRLLDGLFPRGTGQDGPASWQGWIWNEEWTISYAEVSALIKERNVKNAAPGPDGFRSTLWKRVPGCMIDKVTVCLNACLKEGIFPECWKRANLVLIPKESKGVVSDLPKVRPICLLDEIGKTFERIIADRLTDWLGENSDEDLSDNQFGFRRQRSTCDALVKVRTLTSDIVRKGGRDRHSYRH